MEGLMIDELEEYSLDVSDESRHMDEHRHRQPSLA
jgi:hypothetical protein